MVVPRCLFLSVGLPLAPSTLALLPPLARTSLYPWVVVVLVVLVVVVVAVVSVVGAATGAVAAEQWYMVLVVLTK